MTSGHFGSAGESIEYGNADILFPVEELDASVYQYRDARLALANVTGDDVIIIAPTSMATSYSLTQHSLTAIPIESLSTAVRAELNNVLEASIETFEIIQIGKWNSSSPDHSLAEFIQA